MELPRCAVCSLTRRALNQRKGWWECSRVECPERGRQTVGVKDGVGTSPIQPHLAEENNDAERQ